MNTTPQGNEQHSSHIPALATLGWQFLPAKALMQQLLTEGRQVRVEASAA